MVLMFLASHAAIALLACLFLAPYDFCGFNCYVPFDSRLWEFRFKKGPYDMIYGPSSLSDWDVWKQFE
jgi:hypothetical protein